MVEFLEKVIRKEYDTNKSVPADRYKTNFYNRESEVKRFDKLDMMGCECDCIVCNGGCVICRQ